MKFACYNCNRRFDARLEFCPTCGRTGTFSPVVERPGTRPPSTGAEVVTGAELIRGARGRTRWPGVWSVLFPEGLDLPSMLVIWGGPGAGKSTLTVELLAAARGRSLCLPYETGVHAPQLVSLVAQLEAVKVDFALPDMWEDILALVASYDVLAVDSLQMSGADPGAWRTAVVERGRTLILVSEVNAAGRVRGGVAASHLADVSVELPTFGRFAVRKSRSGALTEGVWR